MSETTTMTPATQPADMAGAVEVVLYRLRAGVAEDAFLATRPLVDAALASYAGYLQRRLLRAADGRWMDIVDWRTLAEAQAAAAAFERDPELAPFMALLDPSDMLFLHLEPERG